MSSVIAFGKPFEAGLAAAGFAAAAFVAAGLSTFAAAALVFAAAGLAAAGFAAALAGAALAAVFGFDAAADLAALGVLLSAAALSLFFAGAVVLAAFATCLSLSRSIWAPASARSVLHAGPDFPGNPAHHLCIASIRDRASLAPAAMRGKICRRIQLSTAFLEGRRTSSTAASRARFPRQPINKKIPLLIML
nr:hypothetical protein [Mesorhizobium sp. M2E.F.Ca.ET.219.01.1.1]